MLKNAHFSTIFSDKSGITSFGVTVTVGKTGGGTGRGTYSVATLGLAVTTAGSEETIGLSMTTAASVEMTTPEFLE